jgi:hypothetical protein
MMADGDLSINRICRIGALTKDQQYFLMYLYQVSASLVRTCTTHSPMIRRKWTVLAAQVQM